jgi:kinesin family protein 18/19
LSYAFKVISHWQGRKGKLYDKHSTISRQPKRELNMDEERDENDDGDVSDDEATSALRNAWNELGAIERETKRYRDIRASTEKELEDCRRRGVALEDVN